MKQKVIIASDWHFDHKDAKKQYDVLLKYAVEDAKSTFILMQVDYLEGVISEPGEEYMWWTKKDGEQVRIDKMESEHLKNCIARLKRSTQTPRRVAIIRNMQEEYYKRLGPAGEVLFATKK